MHNHGWSATFSIGVATFVTSPAAPKEMIELSDALMYAAKRTGKNTIHHQIFDPENLTGEARETLGASSEHNSRRGPYNALTAQNSHVTPNGAET
jgi:hypothetical protein